MNLNFNIKIAEAYTNKSQIARVLTEDWVKNNIYCLQCGNSYLNEFENNQPVADFFCEICSEQYELKSKNSKTIGNNIVDGAYSTMIKRINSDNNPNFFFLTYNGINKTVNNFLIIPKHFFTTEIILKRKPLSPNAKRAGWIGCNIDLTSIPNSGRIFLVNDKEIINKEKVISKWKRTEFIRKKKGENKGWILDIMKCIDNINNDIFTLKEVYKFEHLLKLKYPNNNFIRDKIRQQLQYLRDKGLIEFTARGSYKKII